jgi:hypothetical protein
MCSSAEHHRYELEGLVFIVEWTLARSMYDIPLSATSSQSDYKKTTAVLFGRKWQMSKIFVKTQKGVEEMGKRSSDMSFRVRRILIMVDGIRSVDELRELALAGDLDPALALLEENAYIEPIRQSEAAVLASKADESAPKAFNFRKIPDTPDPKELEMAKHFIQNTLRTFCGHFAHPSIIEAASAANTHEELRKCFMPWYNAIIETGDGRSRAEELIASLLKVI